MTVIDHGLIFQPVLTSLHYTQTCKYDNDAIITLEKKTDVTDFSSKFKISTLIINK